MTEQLVKIFNALCMVATKGEDTIIMGQCLTAMQQVINDMAQENDKTSSDEVVAEEE